MVPKFATLLNRRRFVQGSAALSAAMAMRLPTSAVTAHAQDGAEQTLR
jgi:hypothetical protein